MSSSTTSSSADPIVYDSEEIESTGNRVWNPHGDIGDFRNYRFIKVPNWKKIWKKEKEPEKKEKNHLNITLNEDDWEKLWKKEIDDIVLEEKEKVEKAKEEIEHNIITPQGGKSNYKLFPDPFPTNNIKKKEESKSMANNHNEVVVVNVPFTTTFFFDRFCTSYVLGAWQTFCGRDYQKKNGEDLLIYISFWFGRCDRNRFFLQSLNMTEKDLYKRILSLGFDFEISSTKKIKCQRCGIRQSFLNDLFFKNGKFYFCSTKCKNLFNCS